MYCERVFFFFFPLGRVHVISTVQTEVRCPASCNVLGWTLIEVTRLL
ncbi:unnamed protein product [Staurois parvus]|uniref:Uncharacterized protein n=1 Tax=Staurois parvus TaxID=386267 RepID=A0ABN9BPT9_9NEOB|nr:unnamed protein product [Staurois parvus]